MAKSTEDMCKRLIETLEDHLGLTLSQASSQLGYSNQSPLTRIKKGYGFLGPTKLQKLAGLRTIAGGAPNINWILTGEGAPIIHNSEAEKKAREIVQLLGPDTTRSLIEIIKT